MAHKIAYSLNSGNLSCSIARCAGQLPLTSISIAAFTFPYISSLLPYTSVYYTGPHALIEKLYISTHL